MDMDNGYSDHVYVFMQFGAQYRRDLKNSIISRLSILRGYKGRCLGISQQIDVVEGTWREDRAISVFEFDSIFNAILWLESDPEVRQGDFMNGADIIIVPTLCCPPTGKNLFQLMDVSFRSKDTYDIYMEHYVGGHLPELKAQQGTSIVASPSHTCHRGVWKPHFTVAHQWPSHDQFYKWYRSDDYNYKWKPYRLETTFTNMILFKLEPLGVN